MFRRIFLLVWNILHCSPYENIIFPKPKKNHSSRIGNGNDKKSEYLTKWKMVQTIRNILECLLYIDRIKEKKPIRRRYKEKENEWAGDCVQ